MRSLPHLIGAAAVLLLTTILAADAQDFAAAAAKSAEKFNTPVGGEYGIAFMRSTGKVLVPAVQACASSTFPIGSTYDVVFLVAASGRIERMINGRRSPYGDCIALKLHELRSVAKPPTGSWPVHVRFLHGHQDQKGTQPSFMVFADGAAAQQ